MNIRTDTPVNIVLPGNVRLVGRRWLVRPYQPASFNTTPDDNAYRTRNGAKTAEVDVWHIRYGQAPVGELRHRAPQPYTYPSGVHQCDVLPFAPWQRYPDEGSVDGRPEWGDLVNLWNLGRIGTRKDEDCLFLTVFRPRGTPPAGGWPIAFPIHGGGFGVGSIVQLGNLCHQLAVCGIMCVAPGYRLAEQGFWYDPDRELEPDYDGASLALQDQRAGFAWTRTNAVSMLGNPDNITMLGWSAGGASVNHHLSDPTIKAQIARGYSSGGGGGRYVTRDGFRSVEGYASRYAKAKKALVATASQLSSLHNPARYVSDDIAEFGQYEGIRRGVAPETLMAIFNRGPFLARTRFVDKSFSNFDSRAHVNFYPLQDPVHAPDGGAIAAAVAGNITRPLWQNVANSEAHGLIDDFSTIDRTAQARRLRFFDYQEWLRAFPAAQISNDATNGRILYGHAVFQYPALRIARGMYDTSSAPAWLSCWALMPDGQAFAGHTADSNFFLGTMEWRVGKTGTEANLTARTLRIADAAMRTMAAYCSVGIPDSTLAPSLGFNLFATPSQFQVNQYTGDFRWNIFGTNSRGIVLDAPIQVTQQEWFAEEFAAYLALGAD